MNPSPPETGRPPSSQLRKAVFGDAIQSSNPVSSILSATRIALLLVVALVWSVGTPRETKAAEAMDKSALSRWTDRVIPLPKKFAVAGSVKVLAGRMRVQCDAPESPAAATALALLRPFATAAAEAEFTIRLRFPKDASERALLGALPNSEQAYLIQPTAASTGLELVASTPQGLLYAARTLAQLMPVKPAPEVKIEMPLASITDWPDLAQRGQWGGDSGGDLVRTSSLKLNVLHHAAEVSVDAEGRPTAQMNASLLQQAARLGVRVVPYISHLEQLSDSPAIRAKKGIASTPDPTKPLPSDYAPGLCMSSMVTREMVAGWLGKIAGIDGATEILVWLSEDAAPCFCADCKGKNPYSLEVGGILEAFNKVRAAHPELRLNLLTSQGSHRVNDKIVALLPTEVSLTYYDGGRTYDSSHQPMIYPLLENFAASGRRLGVYPQITHSWRAVFPWTAPQFLQYRAQEFVSKKLHCMIGYAVPSNRHHEFNVAAMAEWTWNAAGRTPEEFARAYAVRAGMPDPGLFAQWAVRAGEVGWPLAESKLLLTAIYDPTLGLGSKVPFDHRFQAAGTTNIVGMDKTLATAREALQLARKSGNPEMICESECGAAGLEALQALQAATPMLAAAAVDENAKHKLGESLDQLDRGAETMRARLMEWDSLVRARSGASAPPGRLLDTAFALLRTCDAFRAKAASIGAADPRPASRLRKIGAWSAADFAPGPTATLKIDVSELIPASGGNWSIGFDFVESAHGADINFVKAVEKQGGRMKVLAQSPRTAMRSSKYERWHELPLEIPARAAGDGLVIEISLRGPPKDASGSCAGTVFLRRLGP